MNPALLLKDVRLVRGALFCSLAVLAAVVVVVILSGEWEAVAPAFGWRGGLPTLAERMAAVTWTAFVLCGVVPYVCAVLLGIGERMHGSALLAASLPLPDRGKVLAKLGVLVAVCVGCVVVYVVSAQIDEIGLGKWSAVQAVGLALASSCAGIAATAVAQTFVRCVLLVLVFPQVALLVAAPVSAVVLRTCAAWEGVPYGESAYQETWKEAWHISAYCGGLAMIAVLAGFALPLLAGRVATLSLKKPIAWAMCAALVGAAAGSTVAAIAPPYELAKIRSVRAELAAWERNLGRMSDREFWEMVLSSSGPRGHQSRWDFVGLLAGHDARTAAKWCARDAGPKESADTFLKLPKIIRAEADRRIAASRWYVEDLALNMLEQDRTLAQLLRAAELFPERERIMILATMLADREAEADQMAATSALAGIKQEWSDDASWHGTVHLARQTLREALTAPEGAGFTADDRKTLERAIARAGAPHPEVARAMKVLGSPRSDDDLRSMSEGAPIKNP